MKLFSCLEREDGNVDSGSSEPILLRTVYHLEWRGRYYRCMWRDLLRNMVGILTQSLN